MTEPLPPMSDEQAAEIAAQTELIEATITKLADGGAKAVLIAVVHPIGKDDARQVLKVVTLKQVAGHPRLVEEGLQKLVNEWEDLCKRAASDLKSNVPKIITEH